MNLKLKPSKSKENMALVRLGAEQAACFGSQIDTGIIIALCRT
jgi:hypothetical protein